MSDQQKIVDLSYTFLTTGEELTAWAKETKNSPWIAFDTEFIGEKRYKTLVCLIQVATPHGLFLIDPISIQDLGPFLSLVSDPSILKITHAGENDYRLLFQNYACEPRNLVDTQLACGFLSDEYPVNFKRLAEEHLGVHLKKGFAVVDWESRPIKRDALKYALEDVVYLREMFDVVSAKLREKDRYDWFLSEMKTWEETNRYEKTILDEVKSLAAVYKMRRAEKLFMIRMISWRRDLAEKRDHSREMVLPTKDLNAIVRMMRNGPNSITDNRHLRNKSWIKHLDHWQRLFNEPANTQELEWIKELQAPAQTDIRQEIVGELIYKYLTYNCIQHEIAIDLVVPRSVMRDLRTGSQEGLNDLVNTWRGEFLGEDVLSLLENTEHLEPILSGKMITFEIVKH